MCEWLVLPSDEFGDGFRGWKREVVLAKRNIREVREWESGVSKWWTFVEVMRFITSFKNMEKVDFPSRIITETNKMTNFRYFICSKWKLGSVKLLGTSLRFEGQIAFFRKPLVPKRLTLLYLKIIHTSSSL